MNLKVPEFLPTGKIISKEMLDTITDLNVYEHMVRSQIQRAEQEIEHTKIAAHQDGYNEGIIMGRKDGFAAMAASLEDIRERFLAMESELSSIVLKAVEQIIGQVNLEELTYRIVFQALQQMADQVAVSILCAPEDHASLHNDISDIQSRLAVPQILGLNIDPLLQPGEFLVETPQGRVHIGLAHQISRLRANLHS